MYIRWGKNGRLFKFVFILSICFCCMRCWRLKNLSKSFNFECMSCMVIFYGIGLVLLMVVLKLIEYCYMLCDLFMEFYVILVVLLFMGIGFWVGIKLCNRIEVEFIGNFNKE